VQSNAAVAAIVPIAMRRRAGVPRRRLSAVHVSQSDGRGLHAGRLQLRRGCVRRRSVSGNCLQL
jgi:hypothetical protein